MSGCGCGELDLIGGELSVFQAEGNYRGAIRSAVRALWNGTFDFDQFWEAMDAAINFGLTQAWYEGAKECGIAPSELTAEERAELKRAQVSEMNHLGAFGADIEQNNKAHGGKLAPLFQRAELWIVRARDIMNRARVMACGDQKLLWELGATEKHCRSCLAVAGKVKRASQWQAADIRPQMSRLECGGWRCDCRLRPTDDAPLSKGPLPRI